MKLATSTFSYVDEWLQGELVLSSLLERVARAGAPRGVEVIGHQLWRAYPHLERDEILAFRGLLEDLELEPAAISAYVDLFRHVNRRLTTQEALDELIDQIATASALGFPVARLHAGVPFDVLERAVSRAERAGVILATEIQGDQHPDEPAVAGLLELLGRTDSPALGLVLDFSVSMRCLPTTFVAAVVAAGLPRDALDEATRLWSAGASMRDVLRVFDDVRAAPFALDLVHSGFVRFGRQDPTAWIPHVPRIVHVHAKLWELDAIGCDPTVRDAELIDVLRAGRYDGFVCSEWGGHAWLDRSDVDASVVTAQHHEHLDRLLTVSPVPA